MASRWAASRLRCRALARCALCFALVAASGCGLHYYDAKTGTEHLWGFGHLRMRVQPPTNAVQAVVKGYSIVGAKVGGSADDLGLAVGYDSRRFIYVSPSNAAFRLEWPRASFFNVRVGSDPPIPSNAAPGAASTNQTITP
jgi:hypothetical protein